jgi:hypothetical protein
MRPIPHGTQPFAPKFRQTTRLRRLGHGPGKRKGPLAAGFSHSAAPKAGAKEKAGPSRPPFSHSAAAALLIVLGAESCWHLPGIATGQPGAQALTSGSLFRAGCAARQHNASRILRLSIVGSKAENFAAGGPDQSTRVLPTSATCQTSLARRAKGCDQKEGFLKNVDHEVRQECFRGERGDVFG